MLSFSQKISLKEAYSKCQKVLENGQAFKKFLEICKGQGAKNPEYLPTAVHSHRVLSPFEGYVNRVQCRDIGYAAIGLKAGRLKLDDVLDPTAGLETHFKVGQRVQKKEPLFTLYSSHSDYKKLFEQAEKRLLSVMEISNQPPSPRKLVADVIQ